MVNRRDLLDDSMPQAKAEPQLLGLAPDQAGGRGRSSVAVRAVVADLDSARLRVELHFDQHAAWRVRQRVVDPVAQGEFKHHGVSNQWEIRRCAKCQFVPAVERHLATLPDDDAAGERGQVQHLRGFGKLGLAGARQCEQLLEHLDAAFRLDLDVNVKRVQFLVNTKINF